MKTIKHYHHTIGFDTIEKINWHLANLQDGWKTLIVMTKKEHIRHHKDKKVVTYKMKRSVWDE